MSRDRHSGVSDQGKASEQRRRDTGCLRDGGRLRGAVYVAGYAVECRLKQRLMQMFDCLHLEELERKLRERGLLPGDESVFTHRLLSLLDLTGATGRMKTDVVLWRQFSLVNTWHPAWRYNPREPRQEDADKSLAAVDTVLGRLRANL